MASGDAVWFRDRAREAVEEALTHDTPENVAAALARAAAPMRERQPDEAEAAIRKYIADELQKIAATYDRATNPPPADVVYRMGRLLWLQGGGA